MRKLLFCFSITALGSAATAEPTPPAQPVSQVAVSPQPQVRDNKPQPPAEKKICRNLDGGFSHQTERVCMTEKQWNEYDRDGA